MKRKLFNKDYVLLFQGSAVSTIGDLMYGVAIGYWAAVMCGFLGDVFPLYIAFTVGCAISLAPMLYLCLYPRTKKFVVTH